MILIGPFPTSNNFFHLTKPEPKPLKSIAGYLLRPYFCVKRGLATPEICLLWLHHLGALEHLPEDEEEEEDQNANIGSEEVGKLVRSPWALSEDLEAVEEDDERKVGKRHPGEVRLPLALEDHRVAVDILSETGLVETGEGVANRAPCEERGNCGQVLEPREDLVGASTHTHVRKQRDGGRNGDAVDWHTALVALEKELGRLLVLSDTEEVSGAGIQEGIARRGCRSQDDSIDNVG